MAHHIYTTEAIVLKTSTSKEANIHATMLSADFGLVHVHVQGARASASKLRYGIQEYTRARMSFVRGVRGWRLTYVQPSVNYFSLLRNSPEKIALMAKSALLIRRFAGQDDPYPALFDMYRSYLDFLSSTDLTADNVRIVEYICALRILRHLGYVGDEAHVFDTVHTDYWGRDMLATSSALAGDMVRIINRSIQSSHL